MLGVCGICAHLLTLRNSSCLKSTRLRTYSMIHVLVLRNVSVCTRATEEQQPPVKIHTSLLFVKSLKSRVCSVRSPTFTIPPVGYALSRLFSLNMLHIVYRLSRGGVGNFFLAPVLIMQIAALLDIAFPIWPLVGRTCDACKTQVCFPTPLLQLL